MSLISAMHADSWRSSCASLDCDASWPRPKIVQRICKQSGKKSKLTQHFWCNVMSQIRVSVEGEKR